MSPLIILVPLLLIVLAACSSPPAPTAQQPAPIAQTDPPPTVDPGAPLPPATQIPPAAPSPPPGPVETLLFQSDFSQPSIGLKLAITQDTPVQVINPDDGVYGTFDRPADQGDGACDPGPNAYYHTDGGVLYLHSTDEHGWPLCTKKSFARKPGVTLTMAATIAATRVGQGAWGGLVMYNGEANWYGPYFTPHTDPTMANIRILGPFDGMMTDSLATAKLGEFVDFAVSCKDGVFSFKIRDQEFAFPFKPGLDGGKLLNDPHLAVFLGGLDLAVKSLTVTEISA